MNRRGGFQRGRQGKRVQRKIQNSSNNEPQKRKARQTFASNESDRNNKKICKFFLAGKCDNPNCAFLHQRTLTQKGSTQQFPKVLKKSQEQKTVHTAVTQNSALKSSNTPSSTLSPIIKPSEANSAKILNKTEEIQLEEENNLSNEEDIDSTDELNDILNDEENTTKNKKEMIKTSPIKIKATTTPKTDEKTDSKEIEVIEEEKVEEKTKKPEKQQDKPIISTITTVEKNTNKNVTTTPVNSTKTTTPKPKINTIVKSPIKSIRSTPKPTKTPKTQNLLSSPIKPLVKTSEIAIQTDSINDSWGSTFGLSFSYADPLMTLNNNSHMVWSLSNGAPIFGRSPVFHHHHQNHEDNNNNNINDNNDNGNSIKPTQPNVYKDILPRSSIISQWKIYDYNNLEEIEVESNKSDNNSKLKISKVKLDECVQTCDENSCECILHQYESLLLREKQYNKIMNKYLLDELKEGMQ